MLKHDWYDPNTKISDNKIGAKGSNFSVTDISISTVGIGIAHYLNDYLKFFPYYDIVKNKTKQLPGSDTDLKDNLLTGRMQFRF